MPDPPRPGAPPYGLGERLLAPSSRFQRYRWVVLVVGAAIEVVLILMVNAGNSVLHPLDPVGAGVVFVSVLAAGLSGALVGLGTAVVGVVASFILLADFSTLTAALNAVGSAIIWCIAAAATGLTVGYLHRQVARRETALEQALSRSLSAREKIERVLDFSPEFFLGHDLAEVSQAICDTALQTFGASGARLCALKDSTLELLAFAPASDRFPSGLSFAVDDYPGLRDQLNSRRPSYIRDARRQPLKGNALYMQTELPAVSVIRVSIFHSEGVIGLLSLTWSNAIERPTEDLFAIIQRFADQAAIAWQNALRVEAQRRADSLRETLDRVLALAPSFHITGAREQVAEAICEAALETFHCSAAALYRVEGDRLRVLARVPYAKVLAPGTTFPLTGRMPLAKELSTGAVVFVPDVKQLDETTQPWPTEILSRAGAQSVLHVPLRVNERGPRNLFVLVWNEPMQEPGDEFLVVVQRFADQAALALAKASAEQLHARLEASLLPTAPTYHPRLEIVTRYRTGERRLSLGGDFVGTTASEDQVLHFIIGDVSGHGPDAAALGATLRSTWRALSLAGESILKTTAVMAQVLRSERAEPNAFATMIMGAIDLEEGNLTLTNAGHLPPLLLGGGQVRSLDTAPTPPLGFDLGVDRVLHRFSLPSSWSLLCYTDGLIDPPISPGSSERFGEERLKQSLADWDISELAGDSLDRLMAKIEAASGGPFADDVALLLISTKNRLEGSPCLPVQAFESTGAVAIT